MLTLIKKTRNSMKMSVKLCKSKLPLFHVFRGRHDFIFLKRNIYVHQGTLLFDIFY